MINYKRFLMRYIALITFMFQGIYASSLRDLDFNNANKETILSSSEEDLESFFSTLTRLSGTDIPYLEIIEILRTPPLQFWKMKLAYNILYCYLYPAEDFEFLKNFRKIFTKKPKNEDQKRCYDSYKAFIKDLEKPARSFKAETKRSFLGDSSDDEA